MPEKMKYKISKEKYKKDEIKIPKGYRLIPLWKLIKLKNEDKTIKKLLIDDYLWAEDDGRILACWLDSFDYDSDFYASDRDVDNTVGSLRGVFVKK